MAALDRFISGRRRLKADRSEDPPENTFNSLLIMQSVVHTGGGGGGGCGPVARQNQ